MNLIFGVVGQPLYANNPVELNDYFQKKFQKDPDIVMLGQVQANIGLMSDGGIVAGYATSETASVYLLGNLYHPLPEWQYSTSPLSEPNLAAEYLLNRFVNYGDSFLDNVTGQYAVLLLDNRKQTVYLATDPAGMRTWYISENHKGLQFSTHLRTLAESQGNELAIDRTQEDFLLIYGFYPHNGTPYNGIRSMPSGQLLSFKEGVKTLKPIRYANPWKKRTQFDSGALASEEQLTERLYDAFMTAVEEQSADDNRAAVLLGGFDSSLVAAALKRLGKKVETFSFSYVESQYNQPHTDLVSKYLGTEHRWIHITQDIFREGLETFSKTFNQPTNWPNYVIQTDYVCKCIRDAGYRFCYSGDGCDTVFLGYPGTYKRAMLLESLPILPQSLVKILIWVFGWGSLDRKLGHPYRVLLNLLRSLGREMPARGFVSFRIMDEISLNQLRGDDSPEQAMSVELLLRELAAPFINLPTLRLAYQGKSLVSPNKNKMIGSSDQNGIAILSPYLHPGLKAFASAIPESLCRPHEDSPSKITGKYALMKMAEQKKLLPPEVIYQSKVAGVDGPIDEWYAGPLSSAVTRILEDLPFDANKAYLEQLSRPKIAERLFKEKVMTDKVISHALSLLVTYASFAQVTQRTIAREPAAPSDVR